MTDQLLAHTQDKWLLDSSEFYACLSLNGFKLVTQEIKALPNITTSKSNPPHTQSSKGQDN